MSVPVHVRRQRVRRLIVLAAAVLACLAGLIVSAMSRPDFSVAHPRTGSPVLSDPGVIGRIARIEARLADARYALVRDGETWRLDEADGYPARMELVGVLLSGLSELSWGEAKTSDARKLDQIGLGDPEEGGKGAELRLFDGEGIPVAALIVGRRDGRLYLRNAGERLAFQAEGDLPALQTRHAWMDFAVLEILPGAIEGVVLEPGAGERLHLVRAPMGGPRDFIPGPANPGERLVSSLAAATPALALSRFSPLDVKPARQLETPPVARHITLTKDGLEVIADAYAEPDGFYLTLRAVEAAEGAHRAADINSRADGWAFRISRFDWADFTVPLADIVERARFDAPED